MTRLAPYSSQFGLARRRIALLLLAGASILCACNGRQEPSESNPVAASLAKPVEAEGVQFQAQAFVDGPLAATMFGFDIRGAGLLPVRISIGNHGGGTVRLIPRQTFLIDQDGQAWPLLTALQASERLARAGIQATNLPRATQQQGLDGLTGFALDLAVRPSVTLAAEASVNADKAAGLTFAGKNQRNRNISEGLAASGSMLFPGQQEARGVRALRLCYQQNGREKFLTLPFKASEPIVAAP